MDSSETLVREIGATNEEFARQLAAAFPGRLQTLGPHRFRIEAEDASLAIEARPLPARRLAALELPRLAVVITLAGTTRGRQRLLARFAAATFRGGG